MVPRDSPSRAYLLAAACGALIFFLNLWICWPLLFVDSTGYSASIEPLFYAIADALRAGTPNSAWWPEWNLGMPFNYTYVPLLHHLVAGTGELGGWNSARAFHIVQAVIYCLGPVALFFLARRLSANISASLLAALAYSLLSPSTWMFPSFAVDTGGYFAGRRLYSALYWSDGPHLAGLALLPFALIAVDRALEQGRPIRWIVAALAISTVLLTNIPAAMALAMVLAALVLAMPPRAWASSTLKIGAAGLAGYALFSPWMPPSSLILAVRDISYIYPSSRFTLDKLPYDLGYLAILAAFVALVHRIHATRFTRFAVIFTVIPALLVASNEYFQAELIGQPYRFHLVMELAMALLLCAALVRILRMPVPARQAVVGVLIAAGVVQSIHLASYARDRIRGEANLEEKSEYKIATWLQQNADGSRVYVSGATSWWLNYWTHVPQLIGCCDQNLLVPQVRAMLYVVRSDDHAGDRAAEISIAWFKTFGIRYVAISSEGSTEPYKETLHPHKFDGILPERWKEEGDVIFEVPGVSKSLADLVWPDEVITREPVNGLDIEPMQPYIRAIEDQLRPQPEFAWEGSSRVRIVGPVPADALLSVRIPYHAGWSASSPQGPVTLSADAIGLLLVHPSCEGTCEVDLVFDGGAEAVWLRILSWTTLALMILWLAQGWIRGRSQGRPQTV